MKQFISWQTHTGDAIEIDDITVIPQSQALQVKFPFGGFVWSRPTGVMIERNGRIETFPILDITRIALVAILGFTLLINIFILLNRRH